MPILTSWSMASRLGKVEVVTICVTPLSSERTTRIVVTGMSGLGVPVSSEKPSCTSSECGASTARMRHHPPCLSPSGPVMK
jgi:hypothetical protein